MHGTARHIGRQRCDMKLDVRRCCLGRQSAHEATALIDADRQGSAPSEQPLQTDLDAPDERTQFIVGGNRSCAFIDQSNLQMILQVFTDPRQLVHDGNAVLREQRSVGQFPITAAAAVIGSRPPPAEPRECNVLRDRDRFAGS